MQEIRADFAPAAGTNVLPAPATKASELGGKSSHNQLLAVLELDPSIPLAPDLIRRHYTRLMDKFAPERVQSLGTEFVEAAQRKREEIENAARSLMLAWNEDLAPKQPQSAPSDLRYNPDLDALFGA